MPRTDSNLPVEPLNLLEHFTGRRTARARVRGLAKVTQGEDLRVLTFWGVAGIGKSALLSKISEDLKETVPVAQCSLRDLKGVNVDREALIHLRGLFEGVDFSKFDLCLSAILHVEGQEAPRLLNARPGFLLAWEIATDLPTGGAAGKATEYLGELIKSCPKTRGLVRRIGGTSKVIELVRRAKSQDPRLQEELIRLFVEGLKTKALTQGTACRAVIQFDHYESLWSSEQTGTGGSGEAVDEWVRQLAGYCLHSGILLVITSRDKLLWKEWADSDFEQHHLEGLSEHDSRVLLSKRGIGTPPNDFVNAPSPLQDAIVAVSGTEPETGKAVCHPLFLNLCADVVQNNRRKGITDDPNLFYASGTLDDRFQELANLFLSSLRDRKAKRWLMELALTPRFDQEAALKLGEERRHYCGQSEWHELLRYSFVEEANPGWYRLHSLFRAALVNLVSRDTSVDAAHQWFEAYWLERDEKSLSWSHSFSMNPIATLDHWKKLQREALASGNYIGARGLLGLWSHTNLGPLSRATLGDDLWAKVHSDLGIAALECPLGPTSTDLLFAIAHLSAALDVYTPGSFSLLWANTRNNLGSAFSKLGARETGLNNLHLAITAYQDSIDIFNRKEYPSKWSSIQNNLGVAFSKLGERERDTERFKHAISAYKRALEIRKKPTLDWAKTQSNLGAVLSKLSEREKGTARLKEAITAHQNALEVYTREKHPLGWARTQGNLGNTFQILADRQGNGQGIERAISAYRSVLDVYTREEQPIDWASAQNALGAALSRLGEREQSAEKLKLAVTACKNALKVYTRQDHAADWARTLNTLGNTLQVLGNLEGSSPHLEQAVAAYQCALEVYTPTPTGQSHGWAMIQCNLGAVLSKLGETETGTQRLEQATTALQNALMVYTRENSPYNRKITQNHLERTLGILSVRVVDMHYRLPRGL